MQALLAFSRAVDRLNRSIAKVALWLVLVAVLVSAGNAVMRKAFDLSSNAWLELQWYLFGAVYLLVAAYTLERNEHIRIDIISNALSKRLRDWIDVFGHVVFLLPFVIVMLLETTPFLLTSFRLQEMSPNAGGLMIWPAKALMLVGFAMLLLQGLSELIKRIAVMRGLIDEPAPTHSGHVVAEELIAVMEKRDD